jgi:hypothetical protein
MSRQVKELNCKTLLVDASEYPLNFLIFSHRLTANAYVGCLMIVLTLGYTSKRMTSPIAKRLVVHYLTLAINTKVVLTIEE